MQQQTINALTSSAAAERTARDAETAAQLKALQTREKAQEDSLTRIETAREKALQAEEVANEKALQAEEAQREQDYQDQRDAQRTQLQVELAAQEAALLAGTETWAQFLDWLKGKNASGIFGNLLNPVLAMAAAGKAQGSAFADNFISELQRAANAMAQLTGTAAPNLGGGGKFPAGGGGGSAFTGGGGSFIGGSGGAGGFAGFLGGGEIPGPYTGRDDKWALVSGGETIADTSLTDALKRIFLRGQATPADERLIELLFEQLKEQRRQTGLLEQGMSVSVNGGRSANEIARAASR